MFQSLSNFVTQQYRSTVFGVHGYLNFTKSAFLNHSTSFSTTALDVDLTGKTAIVTGANSGLGLSTALTLAKKNAHVVLVCRNRERGQKALELCIQESGNKNIKLEIADLSLPADVKKLAESINYKVDILINNAGVLLNERTLTKDGLENTFATNTLGVYYLTELMIPKLNDSSRIVTVSSGGMYNVPLSTSDLQAESYYEGSLVYAQTKRAEVELTHHWARKYSQFKFYSMHPGWSETPGLQTSLPGFFNTLQKQLRTPDQGADTIVWAAISDEVLKCANGSFLFDRQVANEHVTLGNTAVSVDVVNDLVTNLDDTISKVLK
ncbi:hypothetical protein HDV02_002769 [Globomyces sp. JEL0801]|nr:hypothetical protein HDV02_002769 [Globomyces sp. JEL0801]